MPTTERDWLGGWAELGVAEHGKGRALVHCDKLQTRLSEVTPADGTCKAAAWPQP